MKSVVFVCVFFIFCNSVSSHTHTVLEPQVMSYASHGRWGRSVRNACIVPDSTDTYRLDCEYRPQTVTCKQICVFGHTLKEGIGRIMKCEFAKNKWEPIEQFESCKPFIDCSVILGPTGSMKCSTNHMDKGAVCKVSCKHFEDLPAIPPLDYQCDIDGKWTPNLPFCARPGMVFTTHGNFIGSSGAKLERPPIGPKTVLEMPIHDPIKKKSSVKV